MFNSDLVKEKLSEQRADFFNAMKGDDEKAQEQALDAFLAGIQSVVVSEAEKVFEEEGEKYTDESVLVSRGVMKPMTSVERKYFNAAVEKQSLDKLDEAFPETYVEDIFSRLTEEHPLISKVDAQSTGALFKYMYADPTKTTAFWGTIPDDIKQILIKSIKVINFETSKLSGFVPVVKGFFALGPAWLAKYVLTVMYEIMAASLEIAIVKGNGKNQPIGMNKKLSGAVDGVYPDKQKHSLTNLDPESLAGVRAAFARDKLDNGPIIALVHPVTYWTKLFPKLAQMTDDKKWVLTQLPTGEEIVQSYAEDENIITVGNPKNYLLAISSTTELKKYEETLAIEDLDLFIAKFTGTGLAKHQDAFYVYDLSGMTGAKMPDSDGEANIKRQQPTGLLNETSESIKPEVDGTERV
ncbi:phage major capsid protein [Enterococcus sp. DIV1420a]|uniref:phage major capsid protein n=1 Tax=Enterococcus TaxID=1350 RepID=UPI003F269A87